VDPMTTDEFEELKADVQRWYWWGVPTLFRSPWNEDPAECDIALVGVPHSSGNGSTERDQHLGPRALRHVSGSMRRPHGVFDFNPWEACRVHDIGDVPLPEAMDNELCVARTEAFYRRIDQAGAFPVSIGGDHSITGPILKAIGGPGAKLSDGRPVALVHFDAHRDSYTHMPHWLGAKRSAAHWAAYTVEEGSVDGHRSTQIGIRGHGMKTVHGGVDDVLGYRIVPASEFHALGVESTVALLRERIGDAPVYITFDFDALDSSIAPGAANLECGSTGMTMDEATGVLRGLCGLNVIGGDVVCLIPTKDNPNNMTAMAAAALMIDMVALIADRIGNR
jgi:guanidinopropionase